MMNSQISINSNEHVLEKSAKKCKKCDVSFKPIIKRKHRCRNCNQSFCDKCSNYFLDKKYFQSDKKLKNKVRLCEDCYNKLKICLKDEGFITQTEKQITLSSQYSPVQTQCQNQILDEQQHCRRHSKSFNLITNEKKESYESYQTEFTLQQTSVTTKSSSDPKYSIINNTEKDENEQSMFDKISQLMKEEMELNHISDIWFETILLFVKQASHELKEIALYQALQLENENNNNNNNNNQEKINQCNKRLFSTQFLKIKLIPFINYAQTQYMKGLVIKKNIAHKQMPHDIKQGKILLISGSFEINTVSFDTLVKNERKYIQIALEFITPLEVKAILVEKTINLNLLNELQKLNISVSILCQFEYLKTIEKITGAIIIKGIDIFNKTAIKNCVGNFSKLEFLTLDIESINQIKNTLNPENSYLLEKYKAAKYKAGKGFTYLFLYASQQLSTIILSGPNLVELINLKRLIYKYVKLAYESIVELEMIMIDKLLKQDLSKKIKTEQCTMMNSGCISKFSINEFNFQQLKYINLQKVKFSYVRDQLKIAHDVQDFKQLDQYIKENQENYNNKKIFYFCQLCQNSQIKQIEFYNLLGKEDMTIGQYLMYRINQDGIKCSKCQTKLIDHISIRYGPGAYVKSYVTRKYNNLQVIKKDEYIAVEDLNSEYISDDSTKEYMSLQTFQQYPVFTYLKCCFCEQSTIQIRLEKIHLEFSTHRLFQHMISHSLKLQNENNMLELKCENINSNIECQKHQFERIFQQGDFLIKFYTNLFDIYNLIEFSFIKQEVLDHINKVDIEEVEKRKSSLIQYITNIKETKSRQVMISSQHSNINQKEMLEYLDNLLNELINSKFDDFLQFEKYSMQCYDKWKRYQLDMTRCSWTESTFSFIEQSKQSKKLKTQIIASQKRSSALEGQIQIGMNYQSYSPPQYPLSPESPLDIKVEEQQQYEIGFEILGEKKEMKESVFLNKSQWPKLSLNYQDIYKSDQQNQELSQFFFSFIPIYSKYDIGLIGFALNSKEYQQFFGQSNFPFIANLDIDKRPFLKDLEFQAKEIFAQSQNSYAINFNIQVPRQQVQKTSSNNIQDDDQLTIDEETNSINQNTAESPKKQLNSSNCTVTIQFFYPKQFEMLRILNGIKIKQFIKSILSCSGWDSSGGKSGSSFYKSNDDLFVFKAVKESEFYMFQQFAPIYFDHMIKIIFDNQPSVLNKIYGMFSLKNSKGTQYFIAMENLFFGLKDDLIVYDLKGSEVNRWNRKNTKTLLDTNYIIDRNGEPLSFYKDQYQQIMKALKEDSKFLQSVDVVDYSLLLIINKQNKSVKMNIIDYLQQYNLKKQLENKVKVVRNLGTNPTIVNPVEYKDRFDKAMDKYFMGINQTL